MMRSAAKAMPIHFKIRIFAMPAFLRGPHAPASKALPFKGRVWVGMVLEGTSACDENHPHPSPPLEGEGEEPAIDAASETH